MKSLKLMVAANRHFRSAGSGTHSLRRAPDPADSPSSNPSDAGCPQNPWVRCAEYGYCVSFPAWGAGNAYLLDMGEERPGELTGQISINELLIAMGEEPVVSMMDLVVPDDASSITDEPPALPGL